MKFNHQSLGVYQPLDKVLDLFYLSLEAFIATTFKNSLMKKTLLCLYAYRIIGIIIFEVTKSSVVLFIFPNIFEIIYIFYLFLVKLFRKDIFKLKLLVIIFITLLISKLFHEYLLHINVTHPWNQNQFLRQLIDIDQSILK